MRAIHDYICKGVSYDHSDSSPYAHTAAGFFLYPRSRIVCEGYAKAFKVLCDRFGIECALIPGDAGDPHMWNYVKMEDGAWYLVDTTYDDQDEVGMLMDTYFLAGSSTIGFDGVSVSRERVTHNKFSSGANAKAFELPMLSAQKYTRCDHDWEEKTEPPSCEEEGSVERFCKKCGVTEMELLPATGHQPGDWKIVKEADCTGNGEKVKECSVCGAVVEEQEIAATGHVWGQWETVRKATVLEDGEQRRSCSVCGKTQENKIPRIAGFVELNMKEISLKVKQSTTAVRVTGMAEGDGILSWKSSDKKIVSVDSAGKITGKKTGTATVTVTLKSGASASVTVSVQGVKTTGITVTAKSGTMKGKKLTMKKGAVETLSVTLTPPTSEDKVSFSSSNSKVVKVNSKGKLTAKKAGKAKITVKAGKKKVVVTVTVK